MAKAQGKKSTAGGKAAAKKPAARAKSAVPAKKKTAPAASKKSPVAKKPAPAKSVPKKALKPAPKASPKPGPNRGKPATPAKAAAARKTVVASRAAAARPAAKVTAPAKSVAKGVKTAAKAVVAKAAPAKPAPKAPARVEKLATKVKALKPAPPAPVAPVVPAVPKRVASAAEEKKRGRRARPRVHSSGAPAASWLSSEKPRPASFIAAPARAEAPSAIAAPPASSDRLIRPDDVDHPAVRTVPVRIDVEQAAGRYYVIANPLEVTVRASEGIEWDFRYLGGADVSVEEVVVEFEKPSPFAQLVFRTRKPGGARPHRQLSGGAVPSAAGRRVEYTVRAINQFKTELANTRIWVNINA